MKLEDVSTYSNYINNRAKMLDIYRDIIGIPVPVVNGNKNPSICSKEDRITALEWGDIKSFDEVKHYFDNDDNLGVGIILTGDVVVIDIDCKEMKLTPEDVYDDLCRKNPELRTKTLVEKTPSGGFHVYVRVRELPNIYNFTIKGCEEYKIGQIFYEKDNESDEKGNRFVVAAPTEGYRTINLSTELLQLDSLDSLDIVEYQDSSKTDLQNDSIQHKQEKHIPNKVASLIAELAMAKKGERNSTLNKVAFQMWGLVKQGVISESEANELLTNAAKNIGLKAGEIRATIRSAFKGGDRKIEVFKGDYKGMKGLVEIIMQEAKAGNIVYDIYKERPIYQGQPILCNELRVLLGEMYDINISTTDLEDAIKCKLCTPNSPYLYNAVTTYCDSVLEKHGLEITGCISQLCEVLGLNEPIERKYLRKFLIASVARAYEHGCMVDNILLFYGEEGLGKTKAFRGLYGEEYYTSLSNNYSDNDLIAEAKAHWCAELGEFERFSTKKQQSEIKTFITREKDTLRKFHTQNSFEQKRRFVLFASTNKEEILKNVGGNRRYWICIITKQIDLQWIEVNRDYIWAEAIAAYKRGEEWYLSSEEDKKAQTFHNQKFTEENIAETLLFEWITGKQTSYINKWQNSFAIEGISSTKIYESLYGRATDYNKVKGEVAIALKKLGFYKKSKRIGGTPVYLWFHDSIEEINPSSSPSVNLLATKAIDAEKIDMFNYDNDNESLV